MSDSVYLINSCWGIPAIHSYLTGLKVGRVGFLRIIYGYNGIETNNTIALLTSDLYRELLKLGHGNRTKNSTLYITPYNIRSEDLPPEGHKPSFFIPLPQSFTLTETEVREQIDEKMNALVSFHIISPSSYQVMVPLKSRESGELKTSLYIMFEDTNIEKIALVRSIINDTQWRGPDEHTETFKCYWYRDRNFRKNIKIGKDRPMYVKRDSRPLPRDIQECIGEVCFISPPVTEFEEKYIPEEKLIMEEDINPTKEE